MHASALRFDQRNLAPRFVDQSLLAKTLRPLLDRDIEEIERDPPIAVELGKNERIEPFPGHILDDQFVDEIGELAGQMPGIGGGRSD